MKFEKYEDEGLDLFAIKMMEEWRKSIENPYRMRHWIEPDQRINQYYVQWLLKQKKVLKSSFGRQLIESIMSPDDVKRTIIRFDKIINESLQRLNL